MQYSNFDKRLTLTADALDHVTCMKLIVSRKFNGHDLPIAYIYLKLERKWNKIILLREKNVLSILYAILHFRFHLYERNYLFYLMIVNHYVGRSQ